LEFFVLDEADRMLDMGFIHDVRKIITAIPPKRQTLFFSATMPPEIQRLSSSILTNPVKVEVTPVSSTAEKVQQQVYFVDRPNKPSLLIHLMKEMDIQQTLVFTRTKHGADKLVRLLVKAGISADAIHGNKAQNYRQRALSHFKDKKIRALVATDIAARGIDIDQLGHVVNYEIPNIPETYVHRIGRTGRAGASGLAISLCDAEETEFLRDIQKLIKRDVPIVEEHPFPMSGGTPVVDPGRRQQRQPQRQPKPHRGQGSRGNNEQPRQARPERSPAAPRQDQRREQARNEPRQQDRHRGEQQPSKAKDFASLTEELIRDAESAFLKKPAAPAELHKDNPIAPKHPQQGRSGGRRRWRGGRR
jgi:ATP-dependent RNA helicase RhlE